MSVTPEQAGTYRQIAHKLRIQAGPGKPDRLSERPRARSGRYLDEDNPTMVELYEGDLVDVPSLIQQGGLERVEPPRKEAASGKAGR